MSTYLIADTHFNSSNVMFNTKSFRASRLGLKEEATAANVKLINELMILNWNASVHKNDTVYFLGDFGNFRKYDDFENTLAKLKGNKIFILGNHDKKSWILRAQQNSDTHIIKEVDTGELLKINHYTLLLTHYPVLASHKILNIHGHIHNKRASSFLKSREEGGDFEPHYFFNVGVDSPDMLKCKVGEPINLECILNYIENK